MSASGSYPLDTIVGELTLLDGRRQPDAGHLAVLTPPRRAHADRRREILFVFLDLSGGRTNGLARAMLDRLTHVYWRRGGTVTSVLREAISAANAHMLEENRLLPVSHRRRGGLACGVLRDDNLYLAQIGPAQALLAQNGRLVQFPPQPEETVEEPGAVETLSQPTRLPLGVSSGLDIRFSHHYFNAGDVLLLTGDSWSSGLPEGALTAALDLAGGGAQDVMLALERQTDTGAVSALIVECVPRESSAAANLTTERPDAFQPPVERHERYPVAAQEDDLGGRWRPSNPLSGALEGLGEWRDRARRGLRRTGTVLGDGSRTLLTRVLPEPESDFHPQRRRARGARTESVTTMAAVAFAIPLLVVFVVVTFYLQRSAVARREGLVNRARETVEAARQAGAQDAHARWEAALQAAQEALRTAPDDNQLAALRDEARGALDALDHVLRPDLILLQDLGSGEGRRLAAARLRVYALDTAQDQVTQHTLETGDEPALTVYRGERVGDEEVGELRDVVWLEAGDGWVGDALLILTDDNRLLQYSLSWGLSWVAFDTGLAHVNANLVRPFAGKLYVLDLEQGQVWRFPFDSDGFGPPEGYFAAAAPDLSRAVDMTIDGAVYVLLDDGRIYKFLAGESLPFQPAGLPQPLERPVALVSEGDATSGALYVADAGTRSIVALTKSGQFIHQIRAPVSPDEAAESDALAGLEVVALEETGRTLYVLAGGRLYALALPALPEVSGTSE